MDAPPRKDKTDYEAGLGRSGSAAMEQATDRPEVRLGGVRLGKARHVCALFHDRDEWSEVLLPFVREGLQVGDRAVHIIDERRRAEHLDWLKQTGIDVEEAQRKGQLEVTDWLEVKGWGEAHLRGGGFDQHAMLPFIEDALKKGKAQGYRLTRLIGEMEWALKDLPGIGDLLEYEARLNYILPRYDDAVT
jgi:hypothetical protein